MRIFVFCFVVVVVVVAAAAVFVLFVFFVRSFICVFIYFVLFCFVWCESVYVRFVVVVFRKGGACLFVLHRLVSFFFFFFILCHYQTREQSHTFVSLCDKSSGSETNRYEHTLITASLCDKITALKRKDMDTQIK